MSRYSFTRLNTIRPTTFVVVVYSKAKRLKEAYATQQDLNLQQYDILAS